MPTLGLLTTAEAAATLGIARRTVNKLIETGVMDSVRLPGKTGAHLIDAAAVEGVRAARRRAGRVDDDALHGPGVILDGLAEDAA